METVIQSSKSFWLMNNPTDIHMYMKAKPEPRPTSHQASKEDVSLGKESLVITNMPALYLSFVYIYYNILVTYLMHFNAISLYIVLLFLLLWKYFV